MKQLSEQVMRDFTRTIIDRVEQQAQSVLQLVEDNEQRAELLAAVAAVLAHDAAHYFHDAKPQRGLANVWVETLRLIGAGGMCPKIRKDVARLAKEVKR